MSRSLTFAVVLLACASAFPATVAAQEQPTQLDEAARLTFESAREAFVEGRYEEALQRFRQAYQLSPRPGLLYNIAQTLDRLRRDEETVQALRDYLRAAPDASNRAEVEARIRVLEQALARTRQSQGGQGQEQANTTTAPPPQERGIGVLHPAFFLGAAGLAVASGAVLIWAGIDTLQLNDAYLATTDYQSALSAYNAANDRQLLTNVFVGVTAALGAAAVALAIFTDWNAFGGSGETAQLAPLFVASSDGAWLGLGGSF